MKFLFATIIAFAAATVTVTAQSAQDLPPCSLDCFSRYVPTSGCDLLDYTCQCKPAAQDKISKPITRCVISKCDSPQDQLKVQSTVSSICKKYGPSSAGGAGGSSSNSTGSGSPTSTSQGFPTHTGPLPMYFTGAAVPAQAGGSIGGAVVAAAAAVIAL